MSLATLSTSNSFRFLFSNLFPFMRGRSQSASSFPKKKKVDERFLKNTCTRYFSCLPSPRTKRTPSVKEREKITAAGLGKKKVVFKDTFTHDDVVKELIRHYPRLSSAGGFTLMRAPGGGHSAQLETIALNWYNVKDLRSKEISGNGIIYIRPLQIDLDLSPMTNDEVSSNNDQ